MYMGGIWTCAALSKAGRMACDVCPSCGKESEAQDHMWRCHKQQYVVIRERFMTKKDEEELNKESLFTQSSLLLQTNWGFIASNEDGNPKKQYTLT